MRQLLIQLARHALLAWLMAIPILFPTALFAAETTDNNQAALTGQTPSGQTISLEQLRGQVTLVFYWSTDCAVCRSKMPELRANAAGWHGKKFTLLGVNMDAKKEEFQLYEKLVTPLLPEAQKFPSVWGLDPDFKDNLGPVQQLPSAVLVDQEGRVIERYKGRIPPQAWDRIADLL
jgi:peroxiredoxin